MRYKKKYVVITLMIFIICCIQTALGANVTINVNGKDITFPDAKPYINNDDRTMVPVRFISEALNAQVGWNEEKREVSIVMSDKDIRLIIGQSKSFINNKEIEFDTVPIIKEDRTFVPLRFVSEGLGATVKWDEHTRTVLITQDKKDLSKVVDIDVKQENKREIIEIKATRGITSRVFTLSNPERCIIDIPDSEMELNANKISVNSDNVLQIRASQFKNDPAQVRVVLDLAQAVSPQITKEDNRILLEFENKSHQNNNDNKDNDEEDNDNKDNDEEDNDNEIREINNIKTESLSNSTLLTVEGAIPDHYSIFRLSNPNRIVIDLPNVYHKLSEKNWDVDDGFVKQIRTAQYESSPPTVRIVLETEKTLRYRLKDKAEDKMVLELYEPSDSDLFGKTVVVDAGHGGADPGTSGSTGAHEKTTTLIIAQLLEQKLRDSGYNVIMTRHRDEYIGLQERTEIANEAMADLFVSIHHNSMANNPVPNGIGTYYYRNYVSEETVTAASSIQQAVIKATGRSNRKIIPAGFYVLRETLMPAVLIELGFMSNPEEEQLILNSKFQEQSAEGIYQGIEKYFALIDKSQS